LARRAEEELRAAGASPRDVIRSGVDELTASERRVARMAADGMSNKQIAQALFVTVKTVETQLHRSYQKLDVSSRAQLASALEQQP
jgi:DNA-binding NarL/FixJ family response regulator